MPGKRKVGKCITAPTSSSLAVETLRFARLLLQPKPARLLQFLKRHRKRIEVAIRAIRAISGACTAVLWGHSSIVTAKTNILMTC